MWLLPFISPLSRLVAKIFYRFEIVGPPLPSSGPVLLFANHPNSLLDPALVAAAAGRQVKFLAKSTLFTNRKVGWLVRAAGAIPVYRRSDDPDAAHRNVQMFEAVLEQLATGAAVGIFPEGLSHSEPSLVRLKTGTARIALGSWARHQQPLLLVPIGLVLRDKGVFRSEALVVRGEPVAWDDLTDRGIEDETAVRDLTERIDRALRQVTVNLERWRDRPLVECVVKVWSAELGGTGDAADQLEKAQVAACILADLRRGGDSQWVALARQVTGHRRRLQRLGLEPSDLGARADLITGARWVVRRPHWLAPPAIILALASAILFWFPYRLTGWIIAIARPERDQQSTYKTLVGALIYLIWIVVLGVAAGRQWGAVAGMAMMALLPAIGVGGLRIRERWRGAWSDVRRFWLLRSRRQLAAQLEAEQARLAGRLREVYEAWLQAGWGGESPGQSVEVDVAAGEDDTDSPASHV